MKEIIIIKYCTLVAYYYNKYPRFCTFGFYKTKLHNPMAGKHIITQL